MNRSGELGFKALKERQRLIRAGFPEPLGLRVHRAISWLGRAELAGEDHDVRFILLWIAFNAAYAQDLSVGEISGERSAFRTFFDSLVGLDSSNRIYNAVWQRFPNEIRVLLNNQHVFAPFWNHHNGMDGYEDWAGSLVASQKVIATAMAQQDTGRLLSIVFDRLYVLRNQLVHGGATWNSSVNRHQVTDGAAVLETLMPVFIDIMMDNPKHDWGKPFYPVVK
jgi:hypothetical protein